ncbi:MAG: hypothetical protein ACRD0Z_15960 [Acidimicrobiales bacterium]
MGVTVAPPHRTAQLSRHTNETCVTVTLDLDEPHPRGVPFLGICVGFQLLFEASEEHPAEPGLGLWAGRVRASGSTSCTRTRDGGADGLLAASIFLFGRHTVAEAKRHLAAAGLSVRPAP